MEGHTKQSANTHAMRTRANQLRATWRSQENGHHGAGRGEAIDGKCVTTAMPDRNGSNALRSPLNGTHTSELHQGKANHCNNSIRKQVHMAGAIDRRLESNSRRTQCLEHKATCQSTLRISKRFHDVAVCGQIDANPQ